MRALVNERNTAAGLGVAIGLLGTSLVGAFTLKNGVKEWMPDPFWEMFLLGLFLLLFFVTRLLVDSVAPAPTDGRPMPVPSAQPFDIETFPEGKWVYVEVFNHGPDAEFVGEVVSVNGAQEGLYTPWTIRWHDFAGERQEITSGYPRRLLLAHTGNVDGLPVGGSEEPRPAAEYHFLTADDKDMIARVMVPAGGGPDDLYTKEIEVTLTVVAVGLQTSITRTVRLGFQHQHDPHMHGLKARVETS